MRSKPAHILPGCRFCNHDHDPDIECRERPIHLYESMPVPEQNKWIAVPVRDEAGKIIAVRRRQVLGRKNG